MQSVASCPPSFTPSAPLLAHSLTHPFFEPFVHPSFHSFHSFCMMIECTLLGPRATSGHACLPRTGEWTAVWTRDCRVPEREHRYRATAVPGQRVSASPPTASLERLPGATQLRLKGLTRYSSSSDAAVNEMSPMAASGGSLTTWTLELGYIWRC